MKKRMYLLMLALLVLGTASMNAQVKIGNSTADPHTGAVLDLKNTGVNKGLLLPNVALGSDLSVFVLDTDGTYTKENATGMLVYNTTDSKVYVWDGAKWGLVSGGGNSGTVIGTSCPGVTFTVALLNAPVSACSSSALSVDIKVEAKGGSGSFTYNGDFNADGTLKSGIKMPASGGKILHVKATDNTGGCYGEYDFVIPAQTNGCISPINPDGSTNMTVGTRDYKTYVYNTGDSNAAQVWMVSNSMEGTSSATGDNGYFYAWQNTASACPDPWHLPTYAEWARLCGIVNTDQTPGIIKTWWKLNSSGAFAGNYNNGTFSGSGFVGSWWSADPVLQYFNSNGQMYAMDIYRFSNWLSVRCVKNQ